MITLPPQAVAVFFIKVASSMKYRTFAEFYPFYLSQHADPRCRACHYIGSTLVLICLLASIASGQYYGILLLPVLGYGCAWFGHFCFEHNKPATFEQPWYSFVADWVMYRDWLVRVLGRGKRFE